MGKDVAAVMAELKLLPQKFHVVTEENATKLYWNSWISYGNWNMGSLDMK